MKKRISLLLCLLLSLTITGCGNTASSKTSESHVTSANTTQQTEETSKEVSETENTTTTQSDITEESSQAEQSPSIITNEVDYTKLNNLIADTTADCAFDFSRNEYINSITTRLLDWELAAEDTYNDYEVYIYATFNSEDSFLYTEQNEKIDRLLLFYEQNGTIKHIIYWYRHCYWPSSTTKPYDTYALLAPYTAGIYRFMSGESDLLKSVDYTDSIYAQIETPYDLLAPNQKRIAFDQTNKYEYQVASTIIEQDDACLLISKSE